MPEALTPSVRTKTGAALTFGAVTETDPPTPPAAPEPPTATEIPRPPD